MKFTCDLCKKEVKRGDKFRLEIDQYDTEDKMSDLSGYASEENICRRCTARIMLKIRSLRK